MLSEEELIHLMNKLEQKLNSIEHLLEQNESLKTEYDALIEEQKKYRTAILESFSQIKNAIENYYTKAFFNLSTKKYNQKIATYEKMKKELFTLHTKIVELFNSNQDEIYFKTPIDQELLGLVQENIHGVMDDYFGYKVAYRNYYQNWKQEKERISASLARYNEEDLRKTIKRVEMDLLCARLQYVRKYANQNDNIKR